ncbi:related to protein RMD1, required for meiotic division [Cephalotrichum gorgonifer]|uniref:Related to protein RMD1, required for meiotic division n=1 Tax=Cephalotrichum gorgonifer TaxID=2041049 RepID=A0AAE8N423_9PEZI|nr:related to protein RMD1, required for meiotic division [Cephalotrichum gorgonifer]
MRSSTHKIVPWMIMTRPTRALLPHPPTSASSHRPLLTISTSQRTKSRRAFHPTPTTYLPRRRDFFTSNVYLQKKDSRDPRDLEASAAPQAKRKARGAGVKKSLRRVAIIAQQPSHRSTASADGTTPPNLISAVCVAEGFNMAAVPELLEAEGYEIDPDGTGFEAAEVVHARRPGGEADSGGDVLVFPSGTVVTWSLPIEEVMTCLLGAAEDPHATARREFEDLEYTCEPDRDTSLMKGDLVVLGTRQASTAGDRLDTTLAKVAFSSGLARSTKLAVLESDLASYFEHTRSIPSILSQGSRLPLSRTFIHQKTGELLSLSARLNNYSELTDSLPDIFWDSRADLGLEGYYDQVGRALDVNVRIRTLNQRLDYAQDIASVLREMSAEKHSTRLEVIIILLIAVEVVFELRREWKEYRSKSKGVAVVDA